MRTNVIMNIILSSIAQGIMYLSSSYVTEMCQLLQTAAKKTTRKCEIRLVEDGSIIKFFTKEIA
jgi:DNA-binding NarL/FixJ family response regulator